MYKVWLRYIIYSLISFILTFNLFFLCFLSSYFFLLSKTETYSNYLWLILLCHECRWHKYSGSYLLVMTSLAHHHSESHYHNYPIISNDGWLSGIITSPAAAPHLEELLSPTEYSYSCLHFLHVNTEPHSNMYTFKLSHCPAVMCLFWQVIQCHVLFFEPFRDPRWSSHILWQRK